MSRSKPTTYEQGQLHLPCRTCDAKPGQWCITDTGRLPQGLHGTRYDDWWRIAGPALVEAWDEANDTYERGAAYGRSTAGRGQS